MLERFSDKPELNVKDLTLETEKKPEKHFEVQRDLEDNDWKNLAEYLRHDNQYSSQAPEVAEKLRRAYEIDPNVRLVDDEFLNQLLAHIDNLRVSSQDIAKYFDAINFLQRINPVKFHINPDDEPSFQALVEKLRQKKAVTQLFTLASAARELFPFQVDITEEDWEMAHQQIERKRGQDPITLAVTWVRLLEYDPSRVTIPKADIEAFHALLDEFRQKTVIQDRTVLIHCFEIISRLDPSFTSMLTEGDWQKMHEALEYERNRSGDVSPSATITVIDDFWITAWSMKQLADKEARPDVKEEAVLPEERRF